MKNKYLFLIVLVLILFQFDKINAQSQTWVAPKSAYDLINPFKGNEKATAEGKKLYNQMCVICHGIQGKGNGSAGVALSPKPSNFLTINVVNETDGAIFWKLTEGKSPMASYKDALSENQRWQLVNYIRYLEKNK
ncbi:cytochrome c [Flavobacterium sp. WC2421]|jgi:mono/diheme cytochrome c family protein|uniref:Cytochrome c n=1 Tax=Flavobacterium sp. WC2409 TaxID=3234139 RepID=A0AB39W4I7_9FLAO